MLSFDSSQQNISASQNNQNATSNQIPYFSVPSRDSNGVRNLRKNSQNLNNLEDKSIVLPMITNNLGANPNMEKSNSQIPSRSNLKRNVNQSAESYCKSVADNTQARDTTADLPLSSSGMSNQQIRKPSSS